MTNKRNVQIVQPELISNGELPELELSEDELIEQFLDDSTDENFDAIPSPSRKKKADTGLIGIRADIKPETDTFINNVVGASGLSKGDIIDVVFSHMLAENKDVIISLLLSEINKRADSAKEAMLAAFNSLD